MEGRNPYLFVVGCPRSGTTLLQRMLDLRDGRNMALSTLEWAHETKGPGRFPLWREEPVAVCALWWRWQVETGRRDGRDLGPGRYQEVKYKAWLPPTPGLRDWRKEMRERDNVPPLG